MRAINAFRAAVVLAILFSPAAKACDVATPGCRPAAAMVPVSTSEGFTIGSVAVRVRPSYPLERSRFTGQPLSVIYNDPGRLPGLVDPDLELVSLPRAQYRHGGGRWLARLHAGPYHRRRLICRPPR